MDRYQKLFRIVQQIYKCNVQAPFKTRIYLIAPVSNVNTEILLLSRINDLCSPLVLQLEGKT